MSVHIQSAGVWEVLETWSKRAYVVSLEGNACIAHMPEWNVLHYPERAANARLIAAAGTTANKLGALGFDGKAAIEALPEILDALQCFIVAEDEWRKLTESGILDDPLADAYDQGRAAISKAKGLG